MGNTIDGDACPHREPAYCAGGAAGVRRIQAGRPPLALLGAMSRAVSAEAAGMLERVTARPVRGAYVDVQPPQAHLTGIEARRGHGGEVTLRRPARTDGSGRCWPVFALQLGVAEAVAALWQRANLVRLR